MIDYSYLLGLSKKELIQDPIKLNKTMTRFAKDFLTGNKIQKPSAPKYKVSNYNELVEDIQEKQPLQSDNLSQMNLEDEDVLIVTQAMPLINDIPRNTTQTLFGLDERDVADIEKYKYVRMMNIVDNPLYLLDLMKSGLLSVTETEYAELFHPEFIDALKATMIEQVTELQGNKEAKLDRQHNRILSNLFKVSRFTPTQHQMLQSNLAKDKEETQSKEMNLPDPSTEVSKTLNK